MENRENRTWAATSMEEAKEIADRDNGFVKTMWCGELDCELAMKEQVGLTSRCMPFQ